MKYLKEQKIIVIAVFVNFLRASVVEVPNTSTWYFTKEVMVRGHSRLIMQEQTPLDHSKFYYCKKTLMFELFEEMFMLISHLDLFFVIIQNHKNKPEINFWHHSCNG